MNAMNDEHEHYSGLGYCEGGTFTSVTDPQQQQQQQQPLLPQEGRFVPATAHEQEEDKDHEIVSNTATNQSGKEILESSVEKAKDIVRRLLGETSGTTSGTTSADAAAASMVLMETSPVDGPVVDISWSHAQSVQSQPQHQRLTDTSYPYAQKRHEFLTAHCQKLNKYYVQNLNYLAMQDEMKLQQQVNHLQFVKEKYAAQQLQQQQQQQQQQQPQKQQQQLLRQKRLYNCMAGIGNQKHQKFQKQLQTNNHGMILSSSSSSSSTTSVPCNERCCGIYVSGLPVNKINHENAIDNDNDGSQAVKDLLLQLFSSFGKISNVKLYRDKKSSKLKGDGLVVYDWSHVRKEWMANKGQEAVVVEDMDEFLKMVCLQVSK
jgi:hypothetical protein